MPTKKRNLWTTEEIEQQIEEDVKNLNSYIAKVASCKDRKIEFNLTFNDFMNLKKRKRCYYTGEILDKKETSKPNGFTLDRKDSYQGYTIANTVPCCNYVNAFKSNWEKKLPLVKQIIKKI